MTRWLVAGLVVAMAFGGSSCGGESVIGSGGFGGDLIGSGGIGATGGTGGSKPGTGGSGASDYTGGSGGSGVVGGTGGGGFGGLDGLGCDIQEALTKSCARTGCHTALDRFGGLDLSDPLMIASQMVDRVAPHSDIGCNAPGTPFRECTPDELAQFCPGSTSGMKLIDSANFENSWVLHKLNGTQGMCGDAMPIAPGNSPSTGWNEARKVCIEGFFRRLAEEGRGMGGAGGTAGMGGMGGLGGMGGTPLPTDPGVGESYVPLCDLPMALKQNCSRTGCHGALDQFAGLNLGDPASIAAQLVDKPATHGDIGCNAPGTPFRACDADELLALGCPPNALLIDSANPEQSWVLKKLRGEQGECGDQMPIAPGNSATNGWSAARLACYEDLFYEMARFAREQRGEL